MISKKKLFALHGWLGLNLGFLLWVICISGTVAVFTPEIDRWFDPPAMNAASGDGVRSSQRERIASWNDYEKVVKQAHPLGVLTMLVKSSGSGGDTPAAGDAVVAYVNYGAEDARIVRLDSRTAQITGERTFLNMKSFVRIFHKQLYMVPSAVGFHGTFFVGLFALVLMFSAITGILVFKGWWRALYTLGRGNNVRSIWSNLHRSAGAWALLVIFLISFTGVWYLAERVLEAADLMEHDPREQVEISLDQAQEEGRWAGAMLPLDVLVGYAIDAFPELKVNTLALPARPGYPFLAMGQTGAWFVRDRANVVALDPFTGEVLGIKNASDMPAWERLIESADAFHFGTFGGIVSRWVYFLCGLLMSFGILSGAFLYWMRQSRSKAVTDRGAMSGWVISAAFTFVVLGITAYSSAHFILHDQVFYWHLPPKIEQIGFIQDQGLSANVFLFKDSTTRESFIVITLAERYFYHFKNASIEIEKDGTHEFLETRVFADSIISKRKLPAEVSVLSLRVHLDRGDQIIPVKSPPLVSTATDFSVPERPGIPFYVTVGIILFTSFTLLPLIPWLIYLRW